MGRLFTGQIDTDRLHLRCPRAADALSLAEMMTPAISRWLASWPAPISPEAVTDRITKAQDALADKHAVNMVIETKAQGIVIGWTGVERCEGNGRRGDLSYWLGEAHHGSGYGVEAAAAMISIAFEHLDLDAIEAGAQAENLASFAIMRRLWMKPVGERNVWVPARNRDEVCIFCEAVRTDIGSAK